MQALAHTPVEQAHARPPMRLWALAAGVTLLLSACASTPPPTGPIAVSTAAIANAVSAGATELAPAELRSARDKLQRATVALTAKENDLALAMAEQAQVDAQLAAVKARSIKARKAADEVQESTRVLREELDRKAK